MDGGDFICTFLASAFRIVTQADSQSSYATLEGLVTSSDVVQKFGLVQVFFLGQDARPRLANCG